MFETMADNRSNWFDSGKLILYFLHSPLITPSDMVSTRPILAFQDPRGCTIQNCCKENILIIWRSYNGKPLAMKIHSYDSQHSYDENIILLTKILVDIYPKTLLIILCQIYYKYRLSICIQFFFRNHYATSTVLLAPVWRPIFVGCKSYKLVNNEYSMQEGPS